MSTFKKIVASPFVAAGWVAGQVKNGYDVATKAVEPAVKSVAKATSAVKSSVNKAAEKTGKAVQAASTKVKDTVTTAVTKTRTAVNDSAASVKTAVQSWYQSLAKQLQQVRKSVWAGLTGDYGAAAAVFFRTFAGIEYIFAFVYFCLAVAGLAFPGLGMTAVTAQAFAQAGVIVMSVGLVADLVSLWLASISKYEYIPDPWNPGRRILVLDNVA